VVKQEPSDRLDAYEAVFTALAHPVRRRILLTVYFKGGSMTAGEIAATFEHAWPTTTRHLQVLSKSPVGSRTSGRGGRGSIASIVVVWSAGFQRAP
jgi:DNA-binding transcriptional ArsR family regulator